MSTDGPSSRTVAQALEEWRAAERALEAAPINEIEGAEADEAEAREAYREALERASDSNEQGLGPG